MPVVSCLTDQHIPQAGDVSAFTRKHVDTTRHTSQSSGIVSSEFTHQLQTFIIDIYTFYDNVLLAQP